MAIFSLLPRISSDERGATAVEYSLICAMIMLSVLVTVQGMASEISTMWTNIGSQVDEAVEDGAAGD